MVVTQGTGTLVAAGGSGTCAIWAGTSGDNLLIATGARTTLVGGGSGDILFASTAGGNLLDAGKGNVTLQGGASRSGNTMVAGSGTALIGGGAGGDTIFGGSGQATVVLGSGSDLLAFSNGRGGANAEMTIYGFDLSRDRVVLMNFGSHATPDALATARSSGGNTMITLQDGTRLNFLGVSSLDQSCFV
jgi:Ca2+-binding RTX toxin-like protein